MTTTAPTPSLLVFADDWGRHPSSCQHVMGKLLARHDVIWVNTIGMRAPGFDRATIRRAFEKLSHWFGGRVSEGGAANRPPRLRVLNPKMWPWFRSALDRRINRVLLLRQLTPLVKSLPVPPIAVTTIPIVSDLIGRLPVERWVYYCVDDFGLWPGLDQSALRRIEEPLIAKADVLVAASSALRDKLAQLGREPHLMTHGVDLEFWNAATDAINAGIPLLERLARPLVIYWGLVDRRLDVEFLRRLGTEMTEGTIVLVGPEADPDPALLNVPRLVLLPAQPFDRLPVVASNASVLVMPYADLPVTRAIQPLKMLEYLATGKSVVARDLPATREWADSLDLADSPEAFASAVRRRLEAGLPEDHRLARGRLSRESWTEKARAFESWIFGRDPMECSPDPMLHDAPSVGVPGR